MNPSNGRNQRDIQLVSAGIIKRWIGYSKVRKMEAKKGTIQSDSISLCKRTRFRLH
jgi:hypothetical protein